MLTAASTPDQRQALKAAPSGSKSVQHLHKVVKTIDTVEEAELETAKCMVGVEEEALQRTDFNAKLIAMNMKMESSHQEKWEQGI